MTYPAPTCLIPGWRQSSSDPCGPALRLRCNEKIVPTLTFTSMFEDPSRGSMLIAYFPTKPSSWISVIFSFSSVAMAQTFPPVLRMRRNSSLAYLSIFWTISPWTFTSPSVPSRSPSPARLTSLDTSLAARAMSYSRPENSPETPGNFRCWSRMCWSIVFSRIASSVEELHHGHAVGKEVDDVERAVILLNAKHIAQIQTQRVTENRAVHAAVPDQRDLRSGMSRHDPGQRRQHPRLHLEIRLAPGRLQRRGIGQPPRPVLGKPLRDFLVRQALPDPEVLFPECRMLNDGKPMALRHLLGALRAPAERARVDRPQRGAGQPIGHPIQLGHAGGRQLDVRLPVIRVRSGFEQFPVPNQVQPRRI